jgi:hypothetical protein
VVVVMAQAGAGGEGRAGALARVRGGIRRWVRFVPVAVRRRGRRRRVGVRLGGRRVRLERSGVVRGVRLRRWRRGGVAREGRRRREVVLGRRRVMVPTAVGVRLRLRVRVLVRRVVRRRVLPVVAAVLHRRHDPATASLVPSRHPELCFDSLTGLEMAEVEESWVATTAVESEVEIGIGIGREGDREAANTVVG